MRCKFYLGGRQGRDELCLLRFLFCSTVSENKSGAYVLVRVHGVYRDAENDELAFFKFSDTELLHTNPNLFQ